MPLPSPLATACSPPLLPPLWGSPRPRLCVQCSADGKKCETCSFSTVDEATGTCPTCKVGEFCYTHGC